MPTTWARVTGGRSPHSRYDEVLAPYADGVVLTREAAEGFLELYGLSYRTWGRVRRGQGAS